MKDRSISFSLIYSIAAISMAVVPAVSLCQESDHGELRAWLHKENEELGAAIAEFNADCSSVPESDTAAVNECSDRHARLMARMRYYHAQNEALYKAMVEQERSRASKDAAGDAAAGASGAGGLEFMGSGNRGTGDFGRTPDPESRLINPLWIDEIVKDFDEAKLELEACMTDPRMKDITRRSMDFENEKNEVNKAFVSALVAAKSDAKALDPGMDDRSLELKALNDPRVQAANKKLLEFNATANSRQKAIDAEFYATLEKATEDLAKRKAEEILREKWRKEALEKKNR